MSASDSTGRVRWTAALGGLWMFAPALFGFLLLWYIGSVSEWLEAHRTYGLLIYVAVFAVTSGLGVLPTYAQAILGGWVFGLALGVPAALAGFTGGAAIGYVVARSVGRDAVEQRIAEHPSAAAVRTALVGRGFWRSLWTVTLLRLPPNSPFALTNLVMAVTGVSIPAYLVGTVLGMTPRTAVMVGIAAAAAGTGARDIQSLVTERSPVLIIGGIAVMLVVLLILGAIGRRAVRKIHDEHDSAAD